MNQQCPMVSIARDTNRGNKFVLEAVKCFALSLAVSIGIQIISALLILFAGVHENETLVNMLLLWGNALGIGIILLYCRYAEKRSFDSIGFTKKHFIASYVKGLFFGLSMFLSVIIVGLLLGAFKFVGINKNINFALLLGLVLGFAIQSMFEEVLYRGYMMISIARKSPVWLGVIFNSVIFTIMHITNDGFGFVPFVNVLAFGILASVYTLKTGNIWAVSGLHFAWNCSQGCVFGMKVSGNEINQAIFTLEATDKTWANGGVFGPEGGLIVTIVLAIELICMLIPAISSRCESK